MNDKFVFEFAAENDDGSDIVITKSFNVIATTKKLQELKKDIDMGRCQVFNDKVEELEDDYGIHDVSFDPTDSFYGFTTYEVELDLIEELINQWKEFFIEKGFEIGHIQTNIIEED